MLQNSPVTANVNAALAPTNIFGSRAKHSPTTTIALSNADRFYELTMPSQTDNLELIRLVVSKIAEKAGFEEMAVMAIEVAVEEACVNAIKHAHHNNEAMPIRIQIKIDNQKLTIVIIDQGRGFDFKNLYKPDLKEIPAKPRPGGLGITMMKHLMDEVYFETGCEGGTHVRMVKYLTTPHNDRIH